MKLRKLFLATLFGLVAACSGATPVLATDADQPESRTASPESTADEKTLPAPTFASEEIASDAGAFWFGKNLLYAGNNVTVDNISRGLLFAAGNTLQLNSQSEYAFVAGNTITFHAATEKDLFIAGNMATVSKDAKVGRDIFAGAYSFTLEANVPGDVSVGASRVIIKDATIKGNVNLDVDTVTFEGQVQIDGTLSCNDDATIAGLTSVKYGKLETYTSTRHATTAGELWLTKMMSVVGLFFTIAIIFLVFPGAKKGIAREATVQRFGVDLILGIGFVVIVPLLSIIFLLSFFAASTSIFLIGVYLLVLYLAKAFAGAWLGHVIVEKLCHCALPMLVEALVGILVITCASMIPGFNFLVSTLTLVLGAGLIIACLRPGEKKPADGKQVYYASADGSSEEKTSSDPRPRSRQKNLTAKALSKSVSKSTPKTASRTTKKSASTKTSSRSTAAKPSVKTKSSPKSKN